VELVLLSTEPFPFKDGEKESFSEYQLDHRTILVDGEYFSWYGSRLVAAFEYFRKLQQKIQGLA
jgi:iron complex transport system substrate-binding protein